MAVVRLSQAALALFLAFAAADALPAPKTDSASFLQKGKNAMAVMPLEEGAQEGKDNSTEQNYKRSRGGQSLKLTTFNAHHLPAIQLGWGKWLSDPKFTEGLRMYCSDQQSFDWCKSSVAAPGQCLRTEKTLAASDFREGDYFQHLWLKWILLQQALQEEDVEDVYWFDADVAVLSNIQGCADTEGADFMHQIEFIGDDHSINGGQLWFRRCEVVDQFIREILAHATAPRNNNQVLDQVWVRHHMERLPKMRSRVLPQDRFLSGCWSAADTSFLRACTFHACCFGTVNQKLAAMRAAFGGKYTPSPAGY